MDPATVPSQAGLDAFKRMFPGDAQIQALTLDEVKARLNEAQTSGAWGPLGATGPAPALPDQPSDSILTPCEWAAAAVGFDAVCVVLGAVGLYTKFPAQGIEEFGEAIRPALSAIAKAADDLADAGATLTDKALAIKTIVMSIWTGGMFEAAYHAIKNNLTWWDGVLYVVLGVATITAVVATDGVAYVAVIIGEGAEIGFLVSDSVKCHEACA